ncbi:hypothetical protein [Nocardia otitidiscaviarum]|uniref:hypothetical protein n=1 Tax=Nocardia otitidiscaviarum TaxID=1823 RepID=UPI00130DD57D|nr:hypothetical protein [Nocardia otitidiscaviarum]
MDADTLARLIDPDAWRAREEDQHTMGAQWQLYERRCESAKAAERILDSGYAVVKLPDMVVDQSDTPTWPVPDISRWTEVFIRHSDRRIAMDAMATPLDRPEHALAVGAALIAAAQYVLAVRDA